MRAQRHNVTSPYGIRAGGVLRTSRRDDVKCTELGFRQVIEAGLVEQIASMSKTIRPKSDSGLRRAGLHEMEERWRKVAGEWLG
jgi:hypothetical protein